MLTWLSSQSAPLSQSWGLVACPVPPVHFCFWVGGSLHLAELGAEVWGAPPAAPRDQTAA